MLHSLKEKLRVGMSKSEFVVLVDEATNDDPWGPTGAQMDEITRVFHNGSYEIMEELELRIKNRSASWRRCYKSLLVLDHLARNVHEGCVADICRLVPLFRHVATTFHCNQGGQDHGLSVRERSRKLADLLGDPALLKDERAKAAAIRAKVQGIEGSGKPNIPPEVHRAETFQPQPKPNSAGSYDPYVAPGRQRTSTAEALREEQEKADLALAMKLQEEENRRLRGPAGTAAIQPQQQQHQRVVAARPLQPAPAPVAGLTQDELDMRLAIELQRRLDAGEEVSPTLFEQHTSQVQRGSPSAARAGQPATATTKQPVKAPVDDFSSFFAPSQPTVSTAAAAPPSFDPFAAPAQMRTAAPSDDFFNQYLSQRTAGAPMAAPSGGTAPAGAPSGLDLFASNSTHAPQPPQHVGVGVGFSSFQPAGPSLVSPPQPPSHQQLDLFSGSVVTPSHSVAPQHRTPAQDIFSPTPQSAQSQSSNPPPDQMFQQLGLFSGSASSQQQPSRTLGEIVAEKRGAW
jgi:epsin